MSMTGQSGQGWGEQQGAQARSGQGWGQQQGAQQKSGQWGSNGNQQNGGECNANNFFNML